MAGLFVHPDYKEALRASEPFICVLDDLVQAGESDLLREIARGANVALEVGEEDAVLANHIALVLKYDPDVGRDDLAAINRVIEEARQRLKSRS